MAEADQLRYQNEMEEWRENGEEYFTKTDGTKSNRGLKSKEKSSKVIESPRFTDKENENKEESPLRKIPSKKR